MPGFSLPENYISDPEALLRTRRSRTVSSSATPPTIEPVGTAPTPNELMAVEKTLREFSVPLSPTWPPAPLLTRPARTSSYAPA